MDFKEYYQNQQYPQASSFPGPSKAALMGGALGGFLTGMNPLGAAAGAALGYGAGRFFGPPQPNPRDFTYHRGWDGQIYRQPKEKNFNVTPEEAIKLNKDVNHPYHYRQDRNGNYYPVLKPSFYGRYSAMH